MLRSVCTISRTAQTEMCADFKSERRGSLYREHFTVLAIWTLVYRELVTRTFCWGCVPRTSMNGPMVYWWEWSVLWERLVGFYSLEMDRDESQCQWKVAKANNSIWIHFFVTVYFTGRDVPCKLGVSNQ